MKKISFIHLTALIGVASVFTLSAASAELVRGHVKKTSGDVSLITASGATVKVTQDTAIPVGSKIVTGSHGQLSVDWLDGAHSIIEKNTTLEVQSLQISEDSGMIDRKVVLKLDGGKILCQFLHSKGSTYILKDRGLVVTDKGTTIALTDDGSKACVTVLSGSVSVSDNGGDSSTITTGNSLCTTPTGGTDSITVDPTDIASDSSALNSGFGSDGGGGTVGDTSGGGNNPVSAPPGSDPLTNGAGASGGTNPGSSLQTANQLTGNSNAASQTQ